MLGGLDEPDSGGIVKPADLTIGYLPQDGLAHSGRTVFEEASSAFQPLLDMKTEMHDIEHRLGDASVAQDEHDAMLARYSELQDRFRLAEGYSMDLRIATVLRVSVFSPEDGERPAGTFSRRMADAHRARQAAARTPESAAARRADETILDLEARNWLEEYLGSYPFAVILVSHDRYFLDKVVTRITDLNLRKLTDYVGNYSKYIAQRDAMLERLRQAKKEQDEEVARVKMFIDRSATRRPKPRRYRAASRCSRRSFRSRCRPNESGSTSRSRPAARAAHRARADARAQGVRSAHVFRNLSLHIERGDRIAAGRPERIRQVDADAHAVGRGSAGSGTRTVGHEVVMEYFAQDEATRLNPTLTVYETLEAGSAIDMVPAIRNILGGFLFSGDDVYKKAGVLSGGERTRLAVARMLLRPSNTLLLDEPTNHLDLDSKDVLLEALEDYGGTLIFVSHDRYFVEKLATRIIEVGHAEAIVYPGTYTEFLWSKEHQGETRKIPNPKSQSPNPKNSQRPRSGSQGGFAVARRKKT